MICGTQVASITQAQLVNALAAGMKLEAYVWLDWDTGMQRQVGAALDIIEGFPVRRLWLDVEQNIGVFDQSDIIEKIYDAVEASGNMPCGIYTSVSKWRALTGNVRRFGYLPLWAAYYTDDDSIDNWGGPLGDWQQAQMRQHDGDAELCGVRVDKNVYRL